MEKVLVVGSGGREHALGWNLAQHDDVERVYYAPGNAGTLCEPKSSRILLDCSSHENFGALVDAIDREGIGLVVVGPEQPLVAGIGDYLAPRGITVFGPSRRAARLETDKFYSHVLMERTGIPHAEASMCSTREQALHEIWKRTGPEGVVLKSRWLAGGKGVLVCDSAEDAIRGLDSLIRRYGDDVLICERLTGSEFSVFAICDGKNGYPIEIAVRDYKRRDDGDMGPNTGGMGSIAPAPGVTSALIHRINEDVFTPVLDEMHRRCVPYTGFLYAGMMQTQHGYRVLEFNARMGDPECQSLVRLMETSLYEPLALAAHGKVSEAIMGYKHGGACCVVLSSKGYPEQPELGRIIEGIEDANSMAGVKVFHAGTRFVGDSIITSGGRVLGITAYDDAGIADATRKAYQAVSRISTIDGLRCLSAEEGFHYRHDVGRNPTARCLIDDS